MTKRVVDHDEDPLIVQYDNLVKLTSSHEWGVFVDILSKHQQWLQREVNRCVEEHDLVGANSALRAKKDCNTIMKLIQTRVSDLKKEIG